MKTPGKVSILLAVCLAIACGAKEQSLNVVIIGVDTLRRDHLGCYGYERETSPNIDRLADESVLFEDAVSQCPWTLPSFATVLTSLYPSQHGAGFLKPGSGAFGNRMSTAFPPLAMMLLKQGYSTGAIVNAPALAPELGVDRGFEFYSTAPRWDERVADATTKDALNWIDEHLEGPFFLFVHYFDPHLTYAPPAPYDTIFDPGYQGEIGKAFDRESYSKMSEHLSRENDPRVQADWNHIRALYDGEIAFTDEAVGELLNGLEKRDLRDNTLIVFLSDHGEEFNDHGGFEHGHTLYDELIKVPLMFSLPGQLPENVRVSQQVRLLDVVPTILSVLGIRPWTHLEGADLMPLISGEGEPKSGGASLLPSGFAYSESMLYGTEKKSVTAYPWKLIYDTVTEEEALLNLAQDPGEKTDLLHENAETKGLLEEVLFKTLLALADTWYIEIAGGRDIHTFDLLVTVPDRPINGRFKMHKFLDSDGRIVDADRVALVEASENVLRLEGLELRGGLIMAFSAVPKRVPVSFDFRVDGEPAKSVTYLGEQLSRVETMPFEQKSGRFVQSKGAPTDRPEPPYILVWHSASMFEGGTPVEFGEDTKRKLRALGYIQ
jgi:arylsulfatase A-like enzyme